MTFDRIQKTLGQSETNNLTADILRLVHAGTKADNPSAHDQALCELLTAMLAMVLVRETAPDEASLAVMKASDRLQQLAQAIADLQTDTTSISVH